MILVFEMIWTGTAHAPGNSSTIQVIARAFPDQQVRVFADPSHLDELGRDRALTGLANVGLHPIAIFPDFRGKTHVVSSRRFAREFAIMRAALRDVPRREPCLIVLISTTPTAIFAAALLARLARRRIGIQVGLHGNLNEITGWRPRNPITRRFDLASALSGRQPPSLRYLVLEQPIKDALGRLAPAAAARTDVLPHPVHIEEIPAGPAASLGSPLRVGFVGQGTQAKGFDAFLSLAHDLSARYGGRVTFHHVGRVLPGTDLSRCEVLADPSSSEGLSRSEFLRRLGRLHYVLLPFHERYYNLSASGALIDAITWAKPVIATKLPLVQQLFDRFGDIGFLCEGEAGLRDAVETILIERDQERYARQVAAIARARDSRRPEALAGEYRKVLRDGFGGLLA